MNLDLADLEELRSRCETLNRIEIALVDRIRKSDQFLPKTINPKRRHKGTHTYSARENAVRLWETRRLVEYWNEISSQLENTRWDESHGNLEAELEATMALSDDLPYITEDSMWSMQSKSRGLARFCCQNTVNVPRDVDSLYPPQEYYGQQVLLEPFYSKMIISERIPHTLSYRDFLVTLKDHVGDDHKDDALIQYLMQAYDRANYLGQGTRTSALSLLRPKVDENPDIMWCQYCQRSFANKNVYTAHLSGKKHLRAVTKAHDGIEPATGAGRRELIQDKKHIPRAVSILELLQPQILHTVAEIDRKSRLSIDDRILEVSTIEVERLEEDSWISDEEHLSEAYNQSQSSADHVSSSHGLPKGGDGNPIPRWLYRLRGLHSSFECEICHNGKYSGRKSFERHFNEPRHLHGLAELGLQTSPAYFGIATIKGAQNLAKIIKRKGTPVFEREVEDDDGNVMSERMYEDLKKQGLI